MELNKDMSSNKMINNPIIRIEVNTYKFSKDIEEFHYEENKQILRKIAPFIHDPTTIDNILYTASLIELLGPKYIHLIIIMHNNNFMVDDNKISDEIIKYIDYQFNDASSYTIVMRKAAKIIEYKYKDEPLCNFYRDVNLITK